MHGNIGLREFKGMNLENTNKTHTNKGVVAQA
jgi:hypothetical protein